MKAFKFIVLFLCVVLTGCKTYNTKDPGRAVVIGMENSAKYGKCPGAGKDSSDMYGILSKKHEVRLLQSKSATKKNVVDAIKWAVESKSIAIIYYSGHGGSEHFSSTGSEEVDNKDEYLALYDTMLLDNEIWSMISKAKGRVFLMFDCCHSETMFRSVGFQMKFLDDAVLANSSIDMICWSGCADNTYSYGGSSGGEFTKALLLYYIPGMSYKTLWSRISADKSLKKFQIVKKTVIGSDFSGVEAFR